MAWLIDRWNLLYIRIWLVLFSFREVQGSVDYREVQRSDYNTTRGVSVYQCRSIHRVLDVLYERPDQSFSVSWGFGQLSVPTWLEPELLAKLAHQLRTKKRRSCITGGTFASRA